MAGFWTKNKILFSVCRRNRTTVTGAQGSQELHKHALKSPREANDSLKFSGDRIVHKKSHTAEAAKCPNRVGLRRNLKPLLASEMAGKMPQSESCRPGLFQSCQGTVLEL
jgi:hypothetical protein